MQKSPVTKAIFGFIDKETGEKLSKFFKKHTGKDVDFNQVQHYKNGFKLLLFSIPLDKFETIGITATNGYPAAKFSKLEDFINWYENNYLK